MEKFPEISLSALTKDPKDIARPKDEPTLLYNAMIHPITQFTIKGVIWYQGESNLYDAQRATVLGEYGGIGLVLKEHLWEPNRNWGYVQFSTSKEATDEYLKYANMLKDMIARGFSAAVYTQTTDVEIEVNGLMTYDRKVIKLDEQKLKRANTEICESLK